MLWKLSRFTYCNRTYLIALQLSFDVLEMATTPAVAYSTALFPAFYDAMVASLPPQFEVADSHTFYTALALKLSSPPPDVPVKILDLCTGTGSIPRHIAAAWSNRDTKSTPLQIIGVDNSEEMLKAARSAWTRVPNVGAEWKLATLGQPDALAGIEDVGLAIISAGSFHHLATRNEQVAALADVKNTLRVGGTLVMNVFPVEEIIGELTTSDLEVWHLNDGFWKQTVKKEVETVADGGVTGTETFRIGCTTWSEEGVCEWSLRAVHWQDVRDLSEELGFVIEHEFASYRDALKGQSADREATNTTGRIFVIRRCS